MSITETGSNPNRPRPFSTLPPHEKVKAVLAVALHPMTPGLTFNVAGIKLNELTKPEIEKVNAIFSDPTVQEIKDEDLGLRYRILKEQGDEILRQLGVDPQEINTVVAEYFDKLILPDE